FVVALLVFALGSGVSIYEGVNHVLHPVTIRRPLVNYVVLALALVFESGSRGVGLKAFLTAKRAAEHPPAKRGGQHPATSRVLAEDWGAILGLLIAFAGTVAAEIFANPVLDGVASIAIGILLALIALVLARETKSLLVGEPARSELVKSICQVAREHAGVERSNGLFTVHLGPRQVVAALSIRFKAAVKTREGESIVAELEEKVRKLHPEVVSVLVKPQRSDRADFQLAPSEDER